jgi:hypothetical protein
VTGTADAAATSATAVTYSGTAQADSAYTLATALKATPAAQNLLARPAPQTGRPGPASARPSGLRFDTSAYPCDYTDVRR